jgi:predicted TIM-barrel fold metal-dependent hydrolase
MPLIDAHQHYWHPARGDYDWMPKDDPILARPYGPQDLAPNSPPTTSRTRCSSRRRPR